MVTYQSIVGFPTCAEHATLQHPAASLGDVPNRIVKVSRLKLTLSAPAVAAATLPLSGPEGSEREVWHVERHTHHCQQLNVPELNPCSSSGSILQLGRTNWFSYQVMTKFLGMILDFSNRNCL
jgi:hypothetical protein